MPAWDFSSGKVKFFGHITNPLLTKLVWSRWLEIGLILLMHQFMDLDFLSVHKKELGQYQTILTSCLFHKYIYSCLVSVLSGFYFCSGGKFCMRNNTKELITQYSVRRCIQTHIIFIWHPFAQGPDISEYYIWGGTSNGFISANIAIGLSKCVAFCNSNDKS